MTDEQLQKEMAQIFRAQRRGRYIKRCIIGSLGAAILLLASLKVIDLLPSRSGPFEEATAAWTRQDYSTAFQLLRPLAERGDVRAQYLIGFEYEGGMGVSQDNIEAAKWYRRAADTGHDIAQWHIGIMYWDGRGLSRDLVSAYMWLDLAAMRGHLAAAMDRDRLAGSMSAAQIAEARGLARKWKPNKGALAPAPRVSVMKQQPFDPDKFIAGNKPASDRVPDISELSPNPPSVETPPSIKTACLYGKVALDWVSVYNSMIDNGYISIRLDDKNLQNVFVEMYASHSYHPEIERTFPIYNIKGKVSRTGEGATPTKIALGQEFPPSNERNWTIYFGDRGENSLTMSLVGLDRYTAEYAEISYHWTGELKLQPSGGHLCIMPFF
jgi:TPR repeat protein